MVCAVVGGPCPSMLAQRPSGDPFHHHNANRYDEANISSRLVSFNQQSLHLHCRLGSPRPAEDEKWFHNCYGRSNGFSILTDLVQCSCSQALLLLVISPHLDSIGKTRGEGCEPLKNRRMGRKLWLECAVVVVAEPHGHPCCRHDACTMRGRENSFKSAAIEDAFYENKDKSGDWFRRQLATYSATITTANIPYSIQHERQ